MVPQIWISAPACKVSKLNLGVEKRPPEEQIAAARRWLAGRRTLLVLDDIWKKDVEALAPGPLEALSTPAGLSAAVAELREMARVKNHAK
jgi:hypothetical protein